MISHMTETQAKNKKTKKKKKKNKQKKKKKNLNHSLHPKKIICVPFFYYWKVTILMLDKKTRSKCIPCFKILIIGFFRNIVQLAACYDIHVSRILEYRCFCFFYS